MPSTAVIWIWFCAYLNCVGWALSALHQLNRTGYACAFAVGLGAVWLWQRQTGVRIFSKIHPPKLRRRFKRFFPLAFLILAALAALGGSLYGISNADTLAYRTTRVLHWIAAGQWHWVHTDFPRLNTRTAGFEWLTAPQFLFFHTDRLVFVLNIICFLLLPGRIFAVLTRLGVRPRAAWYWMWIFPAGYGYVLEAGGPINDMAGAFFTLAAFEFALRAAREKSPALLWTAALAAALMTAVKAFNMMLLLPWGLAALPALPLLLRRPLATLAVGVMVFFTSMIPTSILDAKYCGDWTGANIEQTPIGGGHELLRLPVTSANLILWNVVPPIFPFTVQWQEFVQRTLPESFKGKITNNFEPGLAKFVLPEMQVEESAGLGCGVTLLLLALLGKKVRHGEWWPPKFFTLNTFVVLGVWAGLGVFVLRVGISGPARYLLPFYILLAVPLLVGPVAGRIFSARGWRLAAGLAMASSALLLVLSPQRPLWPANTVLSATDAAHSSHHLLQRVAKVYSVYGGRADVFDSVLAVLPPAANPLGLVTFDEPEAALWRPFGSRRILHVSKNDSAEYVRAQGIRYVLVSEEFLNNHMHTDAADWLARFHATSLAEFSLPIHAGHTPEQWLLTRLD